METTNNEIIELDIDLAWDDTNPAEGLGPILEEIGRNVPSAFVRINRLVGSGGGWPDVTIRVERGEARELLTRLGWDETDIEWLIEET